MIKGASTNCIRFPVFGAIKRALQDPDADRPLPPLQAMLAGGTAGAISAGATHPIDTILGNMQAGPRESGRYASSWQCGRALVTAGGVRAPYFGCVMSCLVLSCECE